MGPKSGGARRRQSLLAANHSLKMSFNLMCYLFALSRLLELPKFDLQIGRTAQIFTGFGPHTLCTVDCAHCTGAAANLLYYRPAIS